MRWRPRSTPICRAGPNSDPFFRLTLDLIGIAGNDGYFKRLNPAWEQCLGWTLDELCAKPYVEFVHPEDRAATMAEAGKLTRGSGTLHFLNRYACRDGSYRWLEWSTAPDVSGELLYCTARDVTAEKQAAEYSRSLLEASLDPLVTISPEGKITDVNAATARVTGIERDKLIGTDFSDYFTAPAEARQGYRRVFADGFVTDFPLTVRHVDGTLTNVLYNASVYKDAAGSVLGVFAAARDVTAQKQASQYARSLLEASLDPLVTISPEGKITDVNAATALVTGIEREKLIGSDFSDYFTEPDQARQGYRRVFADGFVSDFPLTVRRVDGTLTNVLYNASVYKDAAGNVLGVFAAARDVTAQKQAEEALRVANEDLEKHVRERTAELEAFTYSVSHDLRAPLRALNGFVSVLLEDYSDRLDAEGRDSLEEIRSNALRMGRLVDDLLALSRTRQAGDATALRRHDVGGEKGN